MSVSKFVHEFPTWEVYPRVYYFQKRFKDVHKRFNNIINKGSYPSLLKHSSVFDKLEELRCKLENSLNVVVFGRENIEQESLIVTAEPLQRSKKDDVTLLQKMDSDAKTIDDMTSVIVVHAVISELEQEELQEVIDTVHHVMSTLRESFVVDSLLIVCHTYTVNQVIDVEKFRSCVIMKLQEVFGIDLAADRIIFGIGIEMLSCKISQILETQILNGFYMMKEHLQSFSRNKSTKGLEKLDIVESDEMIKAVQGFLKDGFGLVDILEDSQRENVPFLEAVMNHLARIVRCAILDPLSLKFNLKQDTCNHIAHELKFDENLKGNVSKNTKHHLGKLQLPCEVMARAMKERNNGYRFPGRNFMFIAYPLLEDIRQTVLKLEAGLASFQRNVAVMKKMIFEIDGNIQQSIVQSPDQKKKTRNMDIPNELRKSILSIDGVYGTGTVYGDWEVHVKTDEAIQSVMELIDQCKIEQQVRVKRLFSNPTILASSQVEHGSVLESKWPGSEMRFKAGTLGAFADSNNGELYALTCAHVVYNDDKEEHLVYMKNGSSEREPFATSKPNMIILTGTRPCPLIDIAAVKVLQEVCPSCTKYLKDDDGMMKSAELKTESVHGQYIFKYGAVSGFTRGIVCSDDYTIANGAEDYLVLIAPPAGSLENETYALRGDSGSINCMPDVENNKTVKVVSMLSAGDMKLEEMDESTCISFLVGKGLEKLRNSPGGIELTLPSLYNTSQNRHLFY